MDPTNSVVLLFNLDQIELFKVELQIFPAKLRCSEKYTLPNLKIVRKGACFQFSRISCG